MKKSNLLFMLAAGALTLTACSNDDPIAKEGNGAGNDAQQIVLQVANGGDALTTRAGRPLLSSEAKQSIENVHIIITTTDGTVVDHQNVENWNTESTPYTGSSNGREKIVTLNKKLEAGTYRIYAVGHSNSTAYTFEDQGTKKFGPNAILTMTKSGDKTVAEEIFAGSVDQTVEAGKGFRPTIVLHRQVAGIFTYMSNIPYYHEGNADKGVTGTQLRLYAVANSPKLVLGNFISQELMANGTNTTTNVINGAGQTTEKTLIYTIELNKWFKTIKDANNDRLIDTYETEEGQFDNWQNPYKKATSDGKTYYESTFVKGSVFGGEFIIPFKSVADNNTFVLEMTNDDGSHSFQSWVIKLGTSDTPATSATIWTEDAFSPSSELKDTETSYSVFRNHLYGVGTKVKDGETSPEQPDPEQPDPNPEKPEPDTNTPTPIDKKQELTLRVNDNWEIIHHMEIE
ncbi:hypothetical protein [Alistipes sp.]|uniref:hypothetical protein n=1 Tax=Alistipes sp. TaxID=1872444 RepID=UPI0025BE6A98|nr:hypothetical protein [Alistipes sp.]